MAGEVAAVDGRDVPGVQRLQGPRVVPVIEVSLVPIEAIQRAQGIAGAQDQLSGREVAEVVGGQVRQQGETDVGRRGAVRDRLGAVVLHIVGRQPVVLRADKGLEEGPGPPRQRTQEAGLFGRQGRLAAHPRAADPPGDGR